MIELKITDDSAVGFFKQLAEVAAGFTFSPSLSAPVAEEPHDPVMPEVSEAQTDKPKRIRRTAEQIAADNAKAAEPEAVEPGVGESAGSSPADTTGGATSEQTTAQPSAPSTADTPSTDAPIDFDKDVAPVVLGYVRTKGKPWVVAILNQFGVGRASEMAPEQLPELIAALHDAAAE